MSFTPFAITIVFIILASLAIYFNAESCRERKRGNNWQSTCSKREQTIIQLNKTNVAGNAIVKLQAAELLVYRLTLRGILYNAKEKLTEFEDKYVTPNQNLTISLKNQPIVNEVRID